MSTDTGVLATRESWSEIWRQASIDAVGRLEIRRGFGRDLDRLLSRRLTADPGRSCLELGCFPGRFLRYFADRFRYRVEGVEYVEDSAAECRRLLAGVGVDAVVHAVDLLDWEPRRQWDVVASFGLVEHFRNTAEILRHHARLTVSGGTVVVTFPCHHGVYGHIMRRVAPDRHREHNQMSLQHAITSVREVEELDLLDAVHIGRIGFGASRLYEWAAEGNSPFRRSIGLGARIVERVGQMLPNSPVLSPHSVMVLRRR